MIERKNNLFGECSGIMIIIVIIVILLRVGHTNNNTDHRQRGNHLASIISAFYSSTLSLSLYVYYSTPSLDIFSTVLRPSFCLSFATDHFENCATVEQLPWFFQRIHVSHLLIWQSNSTCRVAVPTQNSQKGFHE